MNKKEFSEWLTEHKADKTIWEKYKGKTITFKGDTDISRVTGKVIGMYLATGTLIVEYKRGWLLTKDRRASKSTYIDRHIGKGANRGWNVTGTIEIVKAEG